MGFIVIEGTMFAILVATYFHLRTRVPEWPPNLAPPDLLYGAVNTLVLVSQDSGVRGADGVVGPPLEGVAGRVYLAGVIENNPGNLIRWIQDPPAVDERTAMPKLGVSESDARDIASYLYTSR